MGLTQWLLSDNFDHWLHLLTFISLFLIAIGFFYVSYEVLTKPQGVLRWILIILTHIGLSLGISIVLLPWLIIFFRVINVFPEVCTINSEGINNRVGATELILDVFVYTLMIGSLQGVLTARFFSNRDSKNKLKAIDKTKNKSKIFVWTDFFIGLVFSLVFYLIDDYIVFPTCSIHDAFLTIPDLIQFIALGALGSGFWRKYSQNETPYQSEEAYFNTPFSRADAIRGFLYWLSIGFLSVVLWKIATYWVTIDPSWFIYQIDAIIGIASMAITCGVSRYVTWKLFHMPGKQLGIIGAIITIIGFVLGFIEPLLLFARPLLH